MSEILADMAQYKSQGLIYVCGPENLVNDCMKMAYKNGNHFRRETFLL